MDDKRRGEIAQIVAHFRGKAVTQNVINEYCNLNKIDPIVATEFEDYLVQVEHDEKVALIFKDILAELQNLRFVPEFATAKERKEAEEAGEQVSVNIAKLFEREGIRYNFVSGTSEEIARTLHGIVSSAGTRIFNKATSVLMALAKERFGAEFTTKHSADFYEALYAKAENKEEVPAEETKSE